MSTFYCTVEDYTHKTFWGNIMVILNVFHSFLPEKKTRNQN